MPFIKVMAAGALRRSQPSLKTMAAEEGYGVEDFCSDKSECTATAIRSSRRCSKQAQVFET